LFMLFSLYMLSILSFHMLSVVGDNVSTGDPDTVLERFMSQVSLSRSVTVTILCCFILF